MFGELQSALMSKYNMHLNKDTKDKHPSFIFLSLSWDFQRYLT